MIWFVLPALAADPVPAHHAPRREGELPVYPLSATTLDTATASCTATMHADADGYVQKSEVTGCGPTFAAASEAAAKGWRLKPGTTELTVAFDFLPPVVVRHTEVPTPTDAPRPIPRAPRVVIQKADLVSREAGKPVRCPATFYVDSRGQTFALDLARCPEDARLLAELRLLGWTFEPSVDEGGRPIAVAFPMTVSIR